MEPVATVPAVLAGLFICFGPGLVTLALLARRDQESLELDEALYLMVSVSVATAAWLGLVLAEAGHFSLTTAGGLLAAACGTAALVGRRRLGWPLRWPDKWTHVLPAVLVLILAFWLQARPSEYIVGGRDPGAYVGAMGVIARTGGLVYTDPAVLSVPREDVWLFFRHPEKPPFSWARFMGFNLESPESGRVYPQFFHLFPAFGAYLFQAMGLKGALATPPVFGILGTLGVFFTLRRLFGSAPALLGSALLAVNVIQVWFARYPVSEMVSQFLVFLGLLAFVHWEERGSAAFAGLAGGALGLSLLVRIDSALILIPLALFILVRRGRGVLPWRHVVPLLVPFGLLALHAGIHALFWARSYLLDIVTRPYWRLPAHVWLGIVVLGLGALLGAHRLGPMLSRWTSAFRAQLRTALVVGVSTLALYAYFVRPLLSAWAGGDGNPEGSALSQPALLQALGFHRLAAHDAQAFYRLGWVVGPVGLALGVLGLGLVIRQWRPRYLFPLLTALVFAAFYFYKIRVFNDYPFAFRRYVPVVLPFLLGLAALSLTRLAEGGKRRRALAAVMAVGLMAHFASQTKLIYSHVDWRGAVGFVKDLARRFGPEDAVIFEQRQSIHLLSLPLWAAHGVNILELARFNPDPDQLRHLVEAWRQEYRNIYFVHTYRTDLCGLFLQRVEPPLSFATTEWYAYNRRPGAPEFRSLHFTVSRVVPPEELRVPSLPEIDIGGSDEFQVSGFFEKEGSQERTYRWTGGCASVYVPGARAGATVTIVAGAERRPAASPATVEVSLSGVGLGGFVAESSWEDHTLTLPSPLPPGPQVLRFDVPVWRPINVLSGSKDTRDLGIMVDRIRFTGGHESRR